MSHIMTELLSKIKSGRSVLGINAIMSDIPAYYISVLKLVQTLKRDYDLKRLEYRIRTYSRFKIMIVDEIGYLPLTREESNLCF
jgi:DNA replication protein DnaC